MPPKRARKATVPLLSQEDEIQAAFKQLSLDMAKAHKTSDLIGVPPRTLETIDTILKACRTEKKLIIHPCVVEFVRMLEDDEGDSLCDALDAEVFSTILRVILQMETCKEAERGLHLLAASLFYASQNPESNVDLSTHKDAIGTNCLLQLLNFFVDGETDSSIRRWAGILCIQLVTSCESNHSKLENIPDDCRRSIGRQVIDEFDEILRIIYAQLVRVMVINGTPLDILFPNHYEETVYADFPPSSSGKSGWVVRFETYVDNLFRNGTIASQTEIGELLFAATVKLTPGEQFGANHHNAVLFLDSTQLSFFATSRDGYFDTVLDIPMSAIKKMTYSAGNDSQVDSRQVVLDMRQYEEMEDYDVPCYLDSKAAQFKTVAFSVVPKSLECFQAFILENQNEIEIVDLERTQYDNLDNSLKTRDIGLSVLGESQARSLKISQDVLGDRDGGSHARSQNSSEAAMGDRGETCERRRSQQAFSSNNESSENAQNAQSSPVDPDAAKTSIDEVAMVSAMVPMEDPQDEEGLYDATPAKMHATVTSPEAEPDMPEPEPEPHPKPAIARGRKPVKPKAKPPIVPGRVSLDSQMLIVNAKSQLGRVKPAKDSDGLGQKKRATHEKAGIGAAAVFKKLPGSSTGARSIKQEILKAPSHTVPKKPANAAAQTKAKPPPKKPAELGAAANLKKNPAVQATKAAYNFSDGLIISPHANDASTPNVLKTKPSTKSTKVAIAPAGSQSVPNLATTGSSSLPPRKRYGNYPKITDSETNDRNDGQSVEEKSKVTMGLSKSRAKAVQPKAVAAKSKAFKPDSSIKANAKKRQPAPGVLPVNRRHQRAAATKAKDKMHRMDESDDEEDIEFSTPVKSKSKISKDTNETTTQGPTKPESPAAAADQEMLDIQAEDARSLGLASDESFVVDHDQDEVAYDASPRKPAKGLEPIAKTVNEKAAFPAAGHNKARNSGLDLANKLIDSLGGLDSEPERPQGPVKKSVKKDAQSTESKTKPSPEEAAAAKIVGDKIKVDAHEQQVGDEAADLNELSPVHDGAPPFIDEDTSTLSSLTALVPDDLTTPISNYPMPEKGFHNAPPLPIMQELETQNLLNVLQTGSIVLEQGPRNGLVATSDSGENVAVKQVALTEVRQVQVVEVSKKRKSTQDEPPARKRLREDEQSILETHELDLQPVRPKVTTTTTKTSQKSKIELSTPARKSPRLAAKSARRAADLKNISPRASSTMKDPTRKPQVINFSGRGPQNQGRTSAAESKDKSNAVEVSDSPSPAAALVEVRKRKREKATIPNFVSPPKKKLNSSPLIDDFNHNAIPMEHNGSPHPRVAKSKPNRPRFLSRPSSQASRVDRNGSPRAIESQVDHFGKLEDSLADDQVPKESRQAYDVPVVPIAEGEVLNSRPRRASEIFGPKISLGTKAKAGPSAPGEAQTHYVTYGEFHGVYTDVDTKKIVQEKKSLADPFAQRSRKSSQFIDRLQSSTSKANVASDITRKLANDSRESAQVQDPRADRSRSRTEEKAPALARGALNHGQARRGPTTQAEKAKRPVYGDSSPSDMTSGTSYVSHSSDAGRSPLKEVQGHNETWSLAVRPHYNTIGLAFHRAADEMIIQLSGAEDRMDLLVGQYKEHGTKMVDGLNKKREIQRGTISRKLDQKKSEIASIYGESRDGIMETEESIGEDSTRNFEADWRRKQHAIRKQIAEGLCSSEN